MRLAVSVLRAAQDYREHLRRRSRETQVADQHVHLRWRDNGMTERRRADLSAGLVPIVWLRVTHLYVAS